MTAPNLYADLSKLLPEEVAQRLDALYRDPQIGTDAKVRALLASFAEARTVLLLDNFEDQVDADTFAIAEEDLDASLRAILDAPDARGEGPYHHPAGAPGPRPLPPRAPTEAGPRRGPRLPVRRDRPSGAGRGRDARAALSSRRVAGTGATINAGVPTALEALHGILSADRSISLAGGAERGRPTGPAAGKRGGGPGGRGVQPARSTDPTGHAGAGHLRQAGVADRGGLPAPALRDRGRQRPGAQAAGEHEVCPGRGGAAHLHPVDREYALSRVLQGEEAGPGRLRTRVHPVRLAAQGGRLLRAD